MEYKKDDIAQLWKRISFDDDEKAFESFYYLMYEPLIRFSVMYVNQREEAEEIVSEIFVKCWLNRNNLQLI